MTDLTALSYWFPLLRDAGLPVPETRIIHMPTPARDAIFAAFDGKEGGDTAPFFAAIHTVASKIGYPVFLRTDHTSAKHRWDKTCFLTCKEDIPQHVMNIVEYSEIAMGLIGPPWDMWSVREFLPTIPYGICKRFGNMPVCKEFRFFVVDGDVRCYHPYWPMHALEQGGVEWLPGKEFAAFYAPGDSGPLLDLASRAGRAVEGSWSIDILETTRGWYVTDMAEAHKSFHWEGCPNQFLPPVL